MKRFPLLPQVALVLAAVYACSDATAPANSHTLLSPNDPKGTVGRPPPPPVTVAMTITINSVSPLPPTVFTGVYFSNGTLSDNGVVSSSTFDGTAWLRLDNKQPTSSGTASANARFMAQNDKLSGMGTLFITGFDGVVHVVQIIDVTTFIPSPDCGPPTEGNPIVCAVIRFTATVDGEPGHTGDVEAFDRSSCLVPGEGGGLIFICGGSE